MVLLGLGNLWLLWLVFREYAAERAEQDLALWTVLITALSPMYFLFSHTTMTEVPFMFVSTAALWFMLRTNCWKTASLAGVVAAIAFFTRGYGIVLLPTGFLAYALHRNWTAKKKLQIVGCFSMPLVASFVLWSWYTRHVIATKPLDGITTHYGNLGVISSNLQRPPIEYLQELYWYHARYVVHTLFPYVSQKQALASDWLAGLGVLLAAAVLIGCGVWVKRREYILVLWLLGSAALLLITGINSPRYHLTLLPFELFFLLTAVSAVCRHVTKLRWIYPLVVGLFVMGNAVALAAHLREPDRLRFYSPYWQDFQAAATWAGDNLPKSTLVVADTPQNARAASDLSSLATAAFLKMERPRTIFDGNDVVYLGESGSEVTNQVLEQFEELGREPKLVFQNDRLGLWRFSTTQSPPTTRRHSQQYPDFLVRRNNGRGGKE